MTDRLHVAKVPCGSCPYRKDTPSGIWVKEEYDKLPAYDNPMWLQPTAVFACHQRDGNLCAGWLACHGPHNLLSIRLELIVRDAVPEGNLLDYTTSVPLHGSGAEARAFGLRDVKRPGRAAVRMMRGLSRKGL